ncbi:MAG: hypothetical protein IPL71_06830 [Anaerolineales bacterium]|uniref:hypothetical protein n=1 Tax=Candidatus Villigracilis proximus TaxID=3140683 RepID=UPI00313621D7|nr:hypothetical protein [Anaerolineales bacterium]
MIKNKSLYIFFMILIAAILACNAPSSVPTAQPEILSTETNIATSAPVADIPTGTPTVVVVHTQIPSEAAGGGPLVYDVESSGTAPEKRAPYGDSYDINRMERPFLQDMTYVSDLDIVTYSVIQDDVWFYVSVKLIGNDPNNSLGINYGVELDTDHDGFGDYIIWAQPAYTSTWDTANVKIFADKNHNTAGLSSDKSDAPLNADGYETQIFNGGIGDADPDMAWVRSNAGTDVTIQFAFKKSWSGTVFMLGVIADAGLKDVTRLDYVDRFTEVEAGSPVKDKKNYPLKALFAVDNTCQEAFGFKPQGYESKLCPRIVPTPGPGNPKTCVEPGQYNDASSCQAAGCAWKQNSGVVIAVFYYCTYP